MALLWIDGFELYTGTPGATITPALAARYLTVTGAFTAPTGAFGGYCATSAGGTLLTPQITTNATLIVGGCFSPQIGISTTVSLFQMFDSATLGIDVKWNSLTQELQVYRNTTLLGTTSGANLQPGAWHFIEVKVYCHASAGTVDVHVAGVGRLSLTAQNTKQGSDAYHDRVKLIFAGNGGFNNALDALYIADGSGSVNNDFLGPCQVLGQLPASDSSAAWTRSGGSANYSLVNEAAPDGDTSYVESSTPGQLDLYGYSTYDFAGAVVKGIQVTATARVTDANTYGLLLPVLSDATQSDGTSQTVTSTSYADYRRIVETDPATGVAWTQTGLNAAIIGVKVN